MSLQQPRQDVTPIELFRQLQQAAPIIDGVYVAVVTAANTGVQSARHTLPRAYRGGWVVKGDKAIPLTVLDPQGRATPDVLVYFQLTSAVAGNATLWVF